MVAYTTAKNLIQPANSSYVGTWDVPVNSNWGLLDAILGQTTTIALNNSPVTLSAAQFQCFQIIFSSTLTGSVPITFPSTFTGPYAVSNTCTGSSAFVVTLLTTVSGGQVIAVPPGETVNVVNDGTNLKYINLGRIGTYWDYAGSSVPAWVSACTVPPYLNCDGSTFSSSTYPTLALILGSTTLPDAQGRYRATLNQGTGRITSGSSTGGVDGNTAYSAGGSQTTTLSSQNVPPTPITVTDPGHHHSVFGSNNATGTTAQLNNGHGVMGTNAATGLTYITAQTTSVNLISSETTGITAVVGSTTPTNFSNLPPTYIGGLTLIRAG